MSNNSPRSRNFKLVVVFYLCKNGVIFIALKHLSPSMKFDAIIFDLYDTLITINDPIRPHYQLFNELNLDAAQITAARREYLTTNHHLSTILQRLHPKKIGDFEKCDALTKQDVLRAELFSEVPEVLSKLKKSCRLAVLSNLAAPYKDAFFNLGLDRYIDHTFFSCDLGMMKPESRIYEHALRELNVSNKRVLMVGNSLRNDVQASIGCGMHALLLDRLGKSDYEHRVSSLADIVLR